MELRSRDKRPVYSESVVECDEDSAMELAVNAKYREEKEETTWTMQEKQLLLDGMHLLESGRNYWSLIAKHIGTKSSMEIRKYVSTLVLLDEGTTYQFFANKAPIDAWLEISQYLSEVNDTSASSCLPQLFTVAALEPIATDEGEAETMPDYRKIYEYIAALLRGQDLPELRPFEARVLCDLFDGLISKLANSNTVLQKELMFEKFIEIENFTVRKQAKQSENASANETATTSGCSSKKGNKNAEKENKNNEVKDENCKIKFPSINPFNVPLDLLDIKSKNVFYMDKTNLKRVGDSW